MTPLTIDETFKILAFSGDEDENTDDIKKEDDELENDPLKGLEEDDDDEKDIEKEKELEEDDDEFEKEDEPEE
jgi:hypothetical protein